MKALAWRVIMPKIPLSEGPAAYKTFRDKKEARIKMFMRP
jgi:hypothetical protein